MASRYLITGANGFLGRKLLEEAACRGLRGIAVIQPGTPEVRVKGWQTHVLPLSDLPGLSELVAETDVVINLAGNMLGADSKRFQAGNVETVRHLLTAMEATERPGRLIHVSSVAALGPSIDGIPLGETPLGNPVCLYGKTKLAGERLILKSALADRALILRLCSVYGPGDRCFLDLFEMAENGFFLRLATRSKQFQLMFVEDLVDVLWRLTDNTSLTGVLNVGNPWVLGDDDLQNALGRSAGRSLRQFFLPPGATSLLGRLYDMAEACTRTPKLMSSGKAREMSFPVWLQDFSRQEQFFPNLKWTSLADGIARTRAWYRQEGWL